MTFRARLILVAAAAVALAVVAASAVVYVVVRDQLRSTVDDGLRETAAEIAQDPLPALQRFSAPQPQLGGSGGYPQLVRFDGQVFLPPGYTVQLPVNDRVLAVARGNAEPFFVDEHVQGVHVRVLTATYAPGIAALQVSRPLTEVDDSLGRIKLFLILIAGGGVAVAAALGYGVSRAALARERELPPDERRRLLSDAVEQLGEMTTLIAELIELARGRQHPAEPEDVRLHLVARAAAERVGRNRPGVRFVLDTDESVVHGVPSTLERAIGNLLDNAAKWSPEGVTVEVAVHEGEVTVRDHGPGIDEEDLPYVFDRFYRARSARGQPGSGLGLAIVKQVAETHGGTVTAEAAEAGGTRIRLQLDGSPELDS